MRRKIPNTGALVAFEAAARHESFTRAAQELALTQSAVCRQIGGLEQFLGVPLFRRTRRGVQLTEAGHSYRRQVAARLDEVERDTLELMAHRGRGAMVELAVVPSFATAWLLPRLPRFLAAHPDVTLHMDTRTRPFLFDETTFDAAIYFGDAGWPGTRGDFLMRERALPVCSPRLLGGEEQLTPAQVAGLPLLQQSTRPYAWRQWFEAVGLRVAEDMTGSRFELFSMLAQAAMHDLGVALIPPMLIERELAEGRLRVACDLGRESDKAYYLIVPERKGETEALEAFRKWLVEEAEDFRRPVGDRGLGPK